MELTLIDYDMVHHHPSEIAAAALCLSQKILGQNKWVSILIKHIVGFFPPVSGIKLLKPLLKEIVYTSVTMWGIKNDIRTG